MRSSLWWLAVIVGVAMGIAGIIIAFAAGLPLWAGGTVLVAVAITEAGRDPSLVYAIFPSSLVGMMKKLASGRPELREELTEANERLSKGTARAALGRNARHKNERSQDMRIHKLVACAALASVLVTLGGCARGLSSIARPGLSKVINHPGATLTTDFSGATQMTSSTLTPIP